MQDPNTPAPQEEAAAEYIMQSLEAMGCLERRDPALTAAVKRFYRGIARGMIHFFIDHTFPSQDPIGDIGGNEILIKVDENPDAYLND